MQDPKLYPLASCAATNCPGVFSDVDQPDTVVIRGYRVSGPHGLPLDEGEDVVRIPASVLLQAAENLRVSRRPPV